MDSIATQHGSIAVFVNAHCSHDCDSHCRSGRLIVVRRAGTCPRVLRRDIVFMNVNGSQLYVDSTHAIR
jgi:hypothetical protein